MSTVELDDQLLDAAIAAGREALHANCSVYSRWDDLNEVARGLVGLEIRAAIAHYLANRKLPERMLEAAETLREASARRNGGRLNAPGPERTQWNAIHLEEFAESWQEQESAEAERNAVVDTLALVMYAESGTGTEWSDSSKCLRDVYLDRARALVASGRFDIKIRRGA